MTKNESPRVKNKVAWWDPQTSYTESQELDGPRTIWDEEKFQCKTENFAKNIYFQTPKSNFSDVTQILKYLPL